MTKILGISAYYHDSAAALIINNKLVAAAQEERFTRVKHTADFPVNAIRYCLEENGLEIDQLDAVVFYDKPLLKFERLLETYYAFSPKGLKSFVKSIPIWLDEKLFLKRNIYNSLKEVGDYDKKSLKLLFSEHHLSHSASAFYASPFNESAILTIDGVGEWATASISHGKESKITLLKELHFPHSIGLLYSSFTYFLGFKVNSGEYKLMGLAPYGNPSSEETITYIKTIKDKLISIKPDGSIYLDQKYFNYATGLKMINVNAWEKLFNFSMKECDLEYKQHHCNLALAIQTITEEIVLKMANTAKLITGSNNLCLAGGVALNCVSNSKVLNSNLFKNIFIQPAAGDAGGALGAALAVNYMYFDNERKPFLNYMQGTYLGPFYSNKEIERMNLKLNAVGDYFTSEEKLLLDVAKLLSCGNVVGWFQGRMEYGPRALGNRSILADAQSIDMQKIVNDKIKFRESFRPFAPVVIKEDVAKYFSNITESEFMLYVAEVNDEIKKELPDNYNTFSMKEKLNVIRSEIQAVTHVDFSARLQTVTEKSNKKLWRLINNFKNLTNCSVLINTSFNVRGEPIVCAPEDAFRCFMETNMDFLVINNWIYKKTNQPNWSNKEVWNRNFNKD